MRREPIEVAANTGVNPITFSGDGRLFVSQCFFGTNLYEVDPWVRGEIDQRRTRAGLRIKWNGLGPR